MATQSRTNPPKRRRITFNIQAAPGSTVSVAGDFNQWNVNGKLLKDKENNGHFSGSMLLEPGRYEYKLIINGKWSLDPACSDTAKNDCGTLNNVLNIT
ncbi:MAG TPA: glycogen-binding domain-containing protein [bacterium]|nr:glycogen-binding domain-containing protein [bacterium]